MNPSFQEFNLATNDIFFKAITTTTQLCRQRDGNPCMGTKEKYEFLMKLFVHGLSPIGNIVEDMIASIFILFIVFNN